MYNILRWPYTSTDVVRGASAGACRQTARTRKGKETNPNLCLLDLASFHRILQILQTSLQFFSLEQCNKRKNKKKHRNSERKRSRENHAKDPDEKAMNKSEAQSENEKCVNLVDLEKNAK